MKIAILGLGNIGGGVADVLTRDAASVTSACGQPVEIKYALDLRDFPGHPLEHKIVHDIAPIIADGEVELVVETMGGSHPAYEYTIALLEAHKSVVTSNKEVVANFGDEFTALAAKNGVHYLFEASVGGGIPLIRPMTGALSSEKISEVNGIVNGTTNYILTRVAAGEPFDAALSEAQRLGYAERDPSADVDGIDAQRKITILSALCSGELCPPTAVCAESIRQVTPETLALAHELGGTIKLIAHASYESGRADIFAAPCFVPYASPLSHINDVYNGVLLNCSVSGELMFFGRGAGKYPTSGSIVADIVAVASGAQRPLTPLCKAGADALLPAADHVCRHFVVMPSSRASSIADAGRVAVHGDMCAAILPPARHGDACALPGTAYRVI